MNVGSNRRERHGALLLDWAAAAPRTRRPVRCAPRRHVPTHAPVPVADRRCREAVAAVRSGVTITCVPGSAPVTGRPTRRGARSSGCRHDRRRARALHRAEPAFRPPGRPSMSTSHDSRLLPSTCAATPSRGPRPRCAGPSREAEVGDDVFGDDPTVQRARAAGAPSSRARRPRSSCRAARWATSSRCARTRGRATRCMLERESHIFLYEQGGIAAISGCLAHVVRRRAAACSPPRR